MRSLPHRLKGVGLIAGMVVSGLNVTFGAPIAGMLVASRVTGGSQISMFAALMFCVVAAAVAFVFVRLLAILGAAHDRLVGRDAMVVRRHVSWMRSMSGERPHAHDGPGGGRLSALDVVMITLVVLVVVAFEVWFLFYSGSPLDQRSGR